MNVAALPIIFYASVYLHYTHRPTNAYVKWFCFTLCRLKSKQSESVFLCSIPPYPKQSALFNCSEVLYTCRTVNSTSKMKMGVKQCLNDAYSEKPTHSV
jgi:hypothetical protein